MFFVSMFRQLVAWLFPVDAHKARGEPRPIKSGHGEAGVWLGYSLDGTPECYVIGGGDYLAAPIAICFGTGPDGDLSLADFRRAKSIARNWELAGDVTDDTLDLRGAHHDDDGKYCWLLNTVFFPTDGRGHARQDGRHFGSLYLKGGGFYTALVSGQIPWDGTNRKHPDNDPVPTFEMAIGGGWTPVPAAMKSHLDLIDPVNKNSGQVATDTLEPAKSESTEVATLTAA